MSTRNHRMWAIALMLCLAATSVAAQDARGAVMEPPTAPVAVLPVALYTGQANVQEATDTAMAALADSILTRKLAELLGDQLIPPPQTAAAAVARGDASCNAVVACARAVAQSAGARWVVMAKVSKTSNLIWLLTGQLTHVSDGKIVLDDSTELKGEPGGMIRAGTRIFAERVARTVRAGGVTTNFPIGAPEAANFPIGAPEAANTPAGS